MADAAVHIKGLDRLKRALNGDMRKLSRIVTFPVAQQVKERVAKYPGPTGANAPGRRPSWYERGWGTKWPSNPKRRWSPERLERNVQYGGSWAGVKDSETLNRSWNVGRRGWGSYVGSKASYAPVVHNYEGQAKFHGARGWKTDKQAVDEVSRSGVMDRIVNQAVKRIVG